MSKATGTFTNSKLWSKIAESFPPSKSWHVMGDVFEVEARYELLGRLNATGNVCLCNDVLLDKQVVLKKFKSVFQCRDVAKSVLRELKMLRFLKHESIVNLVSVLTPIDITSFNDVYAVFEHIESSLAAVIASPQPLLPEHIQYFSFQIINAVEFLHASGVMHRNLDSSTVLIDKDCNLRLTDFTNAKIFNPTTQVITRETELGTTARDMFSVGCIMAELLLRRSLFPDVTVANQLKKMYFKRKYALTGRQQNALNVGGAIPLFSQLNLSVDVEAEKRPREKTHEEILGALAPSPAQPLMNGLLHWDPLQRLSAKQALAHEYIADLKEPWDVAHGYHLPRVIPVESPDKEESLKTPHTPLPLPPSVNIFSLWDTEFSFELNNDCTCAEMRGLFVKKFLFYPTTWEIFPEVGLTGDPFDMSPLSDSVGADSIVDQPSTPITTVPKASASSTWIVPWNGHGSNRPGHEANANIAVDNNDEDFNSESKLWSLAGTLTGSHLDVDMKQSSKALPLPRGFPSYCYDNAPTPTTLFTSAYKSQNDEDYCIGGFLDSSPLPQVGQQPSTLTQANVDLHEGFPEKKVT